ncbi:MAG: discoidin domain-containing protein [Sedimentisphaerales bacterium]
MLRKWSCLVSVIFVVGLVGNVTVVRATDWTGAAGDGDWMNPANWDPILPVAGERVDIENGTPLIWPTLDGGTVSCGQIRIAYADGTIGELTITGGATLNVGGELRLGRKESVPLPVGYLYISGADTTILVAERIECGRYGNGTIDMSGGYLHSDAELQLALRDGSSGTVYLRGGTIDLAADPAITVTAGGDESTGLIDISGEGRFTLAGNQVELVETLISSGIMIAYGGTGTVSATFEGNITTVVGIGGPGNSEPDPVDEKIDKTRDDVVLGWKPGTGAVKHDVYFGTVFDDVEQATTAVDPGGVYKGSVNINTYSVAERLELSETYYWRVDAVDASNTIHTGDIWSFTVELLAYPVENIIVEASSSEEGKEAGNTVNGSGLDDSGLLHTNDSVGNMWLSSQGGPLPTWIKFEFERAYKLHEMWVWNSNDSLESRIGLGFKDVTIEYSADGIDYTTLGTTHEFTRAPGEPNYAHDTTIDFEGVAAKYVRLTANSNWEGIFDESGLSEIRFFYIPVHARQPDPESGATEVDLDLFLDWGAGREAAEHSVYISSDEQAVIDGAAPVTTLTETSHGPLTLDLGTIYYWRVDEVNDTETPAIWQGDIWNFTTQEYLVVDDFESYDTADNQIWYAWKDGLGYGSPDVPPYFAGNGTGAAVGDETTESFTEETIVHGGNQSMPIVYNNNKQGFLTYSEATMTLISQRDWTERGAEELSLWFRGYPATFSTFIEGLTGTYTMTARSDNISDPADSFHYAYMQLSGTGSILVKVESVTETSTSAKAGVMIRETLTPDSKYAMVFSRPDGGIRFRRRAETAGESINSVDNNLAVPHWVKLERDSAGLLTASHSVDGINFVPLDDATLGSSATVQMSTVVYIGLALSSNNPEDTCTAVFSEVGTTGTVTGQWQSQDIGILNNEPEPMYVAIANSTGTPAIVYHEDANAATTNVWTQWIIPLQKFADQGVILTDIDSISIGLGNKDDMQPGGSGTLFIDDIGVGRSAP